MERQPASGAIEEAAATAALEGRIDAVLPDSHEHPDIAAYYGLLREYPSRTGKGLRGRITLLSTLVHGAEWRAALTAAAGIELFQNWVLVHDDVEDDSDERRGLPTLNRMVGPAVAINAGDGLHAYMWQLLIADRDLPRGVLEEFLWLIHRTAEGQHLDLSWVAQGRFDVAEADYIEMVRLKTACYTVVSPLRLGAICAGVEPAGLLTDAGEQLGIAFQIRDDVLNLMPDAPHGKEFAGDLYEGKRTLILAHFFAHASPAHREEALDRLAGARSSRTSEDATALLEMFQRYGSIAYAQQAAESRAQRGLELLREALTALPGKRAATELIAMVESLASRRT